MFHFSGHQYPILCLSATNSNPNTARRHTHRALNRTKASSSLQFALLPRPPPPCVNSLAPRYFICCSISPTSPHTNHAQRDTNNQTRARSGRWETDRSLLSERARAHRTVAVVSIDPSELGGSSVDFSTLVCKDIPYRRRRRRRRQLPYPLLSFRVLRVCLSVSSRGDSLSGSVFCSDQWFFSSVRWIGIITCADHSAVVLRKTFPCSIPASVLVTYAATPPTAVHNCCAIDCRG